MDRLWLSLAGLAAGVVSGMGIGGGAVLIPALTFLFGMEQRAAQGVNLIYFIPTAIIALITHVKNKAVETKPLPIIIVAGLVGAAAGAMLAAKIDNGLLRKLFGGFLFIMGIYEFRKKEEKKENKNIKETNKVSQ